MGKGVNSLSAILRVVLVLLLVVTPFFSGCRQQAQQKPPPPPPTVGVSVITEGFEEIIVPFKEELMKLARERQVRLTWKEATDPGRQRQHFDELIKQNSDVILAFLPEEKRALEFAKRAEEKEIKLLAIGMLPLDIPLDGFIGIEARRIGREQGEFLTEALKNTERPKILILNSVPDDPTERQILEGNREALQAIPGLQLFEREMPKEDVPLGLNKIWGEVGALDGVITHVPKATGAVLLSLEGQPFRPVTIGIGAGKEAAQLIAGGHHRAEVDLEPETMAGYALEAALHLAQTGEWEFDDWVDNGAYQIPVQYVPSRVITRENLDLLQDRHGKIEPKRPDDHSSGGAWQENSDEQGGQEQNRDSQGAKIKVKLKDGQQLEFQVPGEIEGIEIQGGKQDAGQQDDGKQGGQQGQDEQEGGQQK